MPSSPAPSPSPVQTRRGRPALLSVVLPAFNEARNLAELLPELARRLEGQASRIELLVVDDGSSDDTALTVHGLMQQGLPVRLLRLSRNFGKEAALTAGLDVADGDVVVTMDADGQHPIDILLEMMEGWHAGDDVVYAVQVGRRATQSWARRSFTRFFYWLMQRDARFALPADAGDFRLLDRRVVQALRTLPERARYMKGLFAWVGFKSRAVEFVPAERAHGETHFHLARLLSLAATGLTAFSKVPLRLVSMLGLLVSLASVAFGIWIVAEKMILGNPISGFATLAASITFLAGVQLLCLGIIAEYLGRVFDEVKQRPLYLVQELTPPPEEAARA